MDLSGSWSYITDVARSRLAHNKTPHHVSTYGDGIEILGAAGEICARRFLGLGEELHDGFDGGCDLLYAGKRIDVKATIMTPKMSYRFMQWPLNKNIKSDIVLMTAVDPLSKQATVIGYATREQIAGAPVNNLRPAWKLLEMNAQRQ